MTFVIKSTAGRGGFAPSEPSYNPNSETTEQIKMRLRATADVVTRYVHPPIPDRRFDWCALHDGEEESNHYGWGTTEAEAVLDLIRLDDERADWHEQHKEDNE